MDASNIVTIPNSAHVTRVEFHPEVTAICSEGRKPFYGIAHIEYWPRESLLEFVSVEQFVHSLATKYLTIEDVARAIFDEITWALGDILLRVTVEARTTVHAPAVAEVSRLQRDKP